MAWLAALSVFLSWPALAEEGFQLDYTRDAAAAACLDGSALRDAVAARLGRDPFRSGAAPEDGSGSTVAVDIRGEGQGLRARMSSGGEDGAQGAES